MRYLNKVYLFTFILFSTSFTYLKAQNIDINAFGYYNEAIRFSQTSFTGTARFQGLAGAAASLGGDVSSAAINPAGLGFFRKSELSFTPAFGFNNSSTEYLGETTSDSRFNMNLSNLAVVFASPKDGLSVNKGGAFSISLSRINDFHNEITYQGVNTETQIVDYFLEQADGVPWTVLDEQGESGNLTTLGLAYFTYLINPDYFEDPGEQDSYVTYIGLVPTAQQETIKSKGAQYEWNISYGGNLDDTFYYGVGLGIQTLRYSRDREYSETINDTEPNMTDLLFIDRLSQSGIGVNLKAGVIYRPIDAVRVGVSFISPTWYSITESYSEEMYVSYDNLVIPVGFEDGEVITKRLSNENVVPPPYEDLTFSLKTPYRLNAGVSFFFGKIGFVSVDGEYVAYNSASLNKPRYKIDGADAGFNFDADNRTIEKNFAQTVNLRIGTEFRIKHLRLRGGFAYYSDPQADSNLLASSHKYFTTGIGFRNQKFYTDFTLVGDFFKKEREPYTLFTRPNPTASAKLSKVRALFSFGVFF
ncbi:hypothetical protein R9C00_02680 [Flammeovirgaceae bacterium SG7u.111]|nr:hypothetical protein [Flammeovirgaceae bacterium SG7u.132]WPO36345.1 hypothetical protein R9C00_02680 [Flammeovirgaceae bacterium SG7u.111]